MQTTIQTASPAAWPEQLGFEHGKVTRSPTTILTIAAQGSLDAAGRLVHEGDPAAQLALALSNVADVLTSAGMDWADVAQLRVYTTDLPQLLDVYDTAVEHLAGFGARPPLTLVEVSRLLRPGMTVAIDGLAAR